MMHTKFTTPGRGRTFGVRRSRRGISLLEVLFAIFVAAVGLLGLAALLTVGGVHTAQSEQADRSTAVAHEAQREVEAREMLRAHVWLRNPATGVLEPVTQWLDASGPSGTQQIRYADGRVVPLNPPPVNGVPVGPLNRDRLDPFVIDPVLMANNGTTDQAGYFFPFRAEIEPTLRLPRLTLRGLYDPADLALSKTASERVFVSHDDLKAPEIDRQSRPQLNPDDNSDGQPDVWQSEGRYSYLVMVTPSELENPYPTQPLSAPLNPQDPQNLHVRSVPLGQRRMFTVQVVVFHRRVPFVDSSPPSERQVKARVVSPHSVILEPPDNPAAPLTVADRPAYLRGLAANQWILLSRTLPPAPDDGGFQRPLHRWVRIVSVGKTQTNGQSLVNFGGPDWDLNIVPPWTPSSGEKMADGSDPNAVATIVDGVVGVYERAVELDSRSMTAP